jgi:hypothetical protein
MDGRLGMIIDGTGDDFKEKRSRKIRLWYLYGFY